jgi:ATP-dependent Lon protease
MELLRLPGYSEEEKVEIAKRYLIPRQLSETGLSPDRCIIPDETLIRLIQGYTREAGLRRLERAIARLTRKVALLFAEGQTEPVTVRAEDLPDMLGPEIFNPEQMRKKLPAGVATGLAWTETGGDVLYIEATLLPDGKGLTLTGQLGDVMQESVKAAQSYIWSHADDFGINHELFKTSGVHLHVPAGAIPKDGPSAGITAAVALASLYTQLPARSDTAMTGEITLRGRVLAIGGFREKALAAHRHGIKRLIAPQENSRDLSKLPAPVRRDMEIVFAASMDQVIAAAICLDEHQVGGLLEGIEPASPAPVPEPMAAVPAQRAIANHHEGSLPGAS